MGKGVPHIIIAGVGYLFEPNYLKLAVDAGIKAREVQKRFAALAEAREYLKQKRSEETFLFDWNPYWPDIDGFVKIEVSDKCARSGNEFEHNKPKTEARLKADLGSSKFELQSKRGHFSQDDCTFVWEVRCNQYLVGKLKNWKIVEP